MAATEWSEGHALRPKRVADDPSFEWSRDLLAEGPQPLHGDRPGGIERFEGHALRPKRVADEPSVE